MPWRSLPSVNQALEFTLETEGFHAPDPGKGVFPLTVNTCLKIDGSFPKYGDPKKDPKVL